MICQKCGTENQDRFKFCISCASELIAASPGSPPAKRGSGVASSLQPAAAASRPSSAHACVECGTVGPVGFVFCGKCGARVDGTGEVTLPSHRPQTLPGQAKGQLVLIRPDGGEAGVFQLKPGSNIVGRGLGPLFDADGYLSPRHADLFLNDAGLTVRDMGSLNGVFLKLATEELLENGDIFRVGQQLLRFEQVKAPEVAPDGTQILGSPNPGYWGKLLLIVGPDQDGGAYPLFGESTTIGRERGDILFSDDGYVSGTHARLLTREGKTYLSDLRSSNGTYLRIRDRKIRAGNYLLMGQQLFRVALE